MAQFDVHKMADGFVVDCQSNYMSDYDTRFVVPLFPQGNGPKRANRLNPIFEIEGRSFVMVTQYAASLQQRRLGKVIVSLSNDRDAIIAAIDMLITGF